MNEPRHIGKEINVIAYYFRRRIDAFSTEFGISGIQARLIDYLSNCQKYGKDVFQRDIENEFRMRRSSVTSLVQHLEQKGLIRRETVETDARLKRVVLTDKGNNISEAIWQMLVDFEASLSNEFTAEELEQLFLILERIKHKFDS